MTKERITRADFDRLAAIDWTEEARRGRTPPDFSAMEIIDDQPAERVSQTIANPLRNRDVRPFAPQGVPGHFGHVTKAELAQQREGIMRAQLAARRRESDARAGRLRTRETDFRPDAMACAASPLHRQVVTLHTCSDDDLTCQTCSAELRDGDVFARIRHLGGGKPKRICAGCFNGRFTPTSAQRVAIQRGDIAETVTPAMISAYRASWLRYSPAFTGSALASNTGTAPIVCRCCKAPVILPGDAFVQLGRKAGPACRECVHTDPDLQPPAGWPDPMQSTPPRTAKRGLMNLFPWGK